MAFIRKIKKGNRIYLAKVKSYRENGKVKQKVIEYIGKEVDGNVIPKKSVNSNFNITKVTQYLDILTVDTIAKFLDMPAFLGSNSKYILALIYSHLITKTSIYKIPEWAEKSEILQIVKLKNITSKKLYQSVENFAEIDFNIIQKMISDQFTKFDKDNNIAVLDITDTYFNGRDANWKSRKGKDGKYDKLIQIALAVTFNHGFPIMHKTYEGNISGLNIFQDMITDLKYYGYNAIIVDRGFCSKKNIDELEQYKLEGIMGMKLTNKLGDSYLASINREIIFSKENQVQLKNTKVYIQEFEYNAGKIIAVYNPSIEINLREKAFDKTNNNRSNKYYGYSLIYHNLSITAQEVVKKYFEKDIVERSFKKLKSSINLHPFNVWKLENIKTHIKICYLAYAILAYIDFKLIPVGIKGNEALKILQGAYKVHIKMENSEVEIEKNVVLKKIQKQIIELLNVVYK